MLSQIKNFDQLSADFIRALDEKLERIESMYAFTWRNKSRMLRKEKGFTEGQLISEICAQLFEIMLAFSKVRVDVSMLNKEAWYNTLKRNLESLSKEQTLTDFEKKSNEVRSNLMYLRESLHLAYVAPEKPNVAITNQTDAKTSSKLKFAKCWFTLIPAHTQLTPQQRERLNLLEPDHLQSRNENYYKPH